MVVSGVDNSRCKKAGNSAATLFLRGSSRISGLDLIKVK